MLYSGGGTGASTSRRPIDNGPSWGYDGHERAYSELSPNGGPSSAPPYAPAYPYTRTQDTSELDDKNLAEALSLSLIEADAQNLARQMLEQENALLAQMSFDRLVGRPLVHRASSSSSYIPASAIPYSSLRDSSKYEEDEEFQKNLAIAQVLSLQDSRPTTYGVAEPRYIAPGFRKNSSQRPGPSSLLPADVAPSEVPLTLDDIDHTIMSDPATDRSRRNKGKNPLFRRNAGIRRSRKMRKSKRRRRKTKRRRRH